MNKIENYFEEHCRSKGIEPNKISTQENRRTPDYYFIVNGVKIIAEVTAINKNEEEKKLEIKRKSKASVAWWPNTEDRIRSKINDKGKQLKNETNNNYPGILILYDNRYPFDTLTGNNFRYAMYGNDSINFLMPNDPNLEAVVTGENFGGNRRMTNEWKTYISALAHLKFRSTENTSLLLYHNYYASIPLEHELCWEFADQQFMIEDPHNSGQKNWIDIEKPK